MFMCVYLFVYMCMSTSSLILLLTNIYLSIVLDFYKNNAIKIFLYIFKIFCEGCLCVYMMYTYDMYEWRHTCAKANMWKSNHGWVLIFHPVWCKFYSIGHRVYKASWPLSSQGFFHLYLPFQVLDTCYCAQFLYRFWDFELRSSHLCGKYLFTETFLQPIHGFLWTNYLLFGDLLRTTAVGL